MEMFILGLFCIMLAICLLLDTGIVYALALGLILFCTYAFWRDFSLKETIGMCIEGVRTARNVLITFLLIGILTAFWRAAGTIPVIVCYAGALVQPPVFLLMTFLLNCMVSVLTGTALGTAATMGVICAAMGEAMHVSPVLVGGAVVSGVYFGDRCSPVSISALLVAELTHTDIFDNIRTMVRTAAVPFLLTYLIYGLTGWITPHEAITFDLTGVFRQEFRLHWLASAPAAVILILSIFRVPVKRAMLISILSAVPVCVLLQGMSVSRLLACAVFGYRAENPEIASMIDGGGIVSMLRVAAIVCLSSAYSGIFRKTGLLDGIQKQILEIGKRITPFGAMLFTSILTGAVACNQTLTIMLTKQLCENTETDRGILAGGLENTAVVIAPLIPWSIASGVPLASVNAPLTSLLFACFLYLLPLWELGRALWKQKRAALINHQKQ